METIHPYVDITIFTIINTQLHVLTVIRPNDTTEPFPKKLALPGGYVQFSAETPSLLDCAKQKLRHKTGVDLAYLEQVETLGSSTRDPRGPSLTIVYFALIPFGRAQLHDEDDMLNVAWTPVNELRDMAFDHLKILKLCHERLKNKVKYTAIASHLLDESFTLTELQAVSETLLETTLSKAAFRKRILTSGAFEETGQVSSGAHRPAKLYRLSMKPLHIFDRVIEGTRK